MIKILTPIVAATALLSVATSSAQANPAVLSLEQVTSIVNGEAAIANTVSDAVKLERFRAQTYRLKDKLAFSKDVANRYRTNLEQAHATLNALTSAHSVEKAALQVEIDTLTSGLAAKTAEAANLQGQLDGLMSQINDAAPSIGLGHIATASTGVFFEGVKSFTAAQATTIADLRSQIASLSVPSSATLPSDASLKLDAEEYIQLMNDGEILSKATAVNGIIDNAFDGTVSAAIEDALNEAYDSGYADGYVQGYKDGFAAASR